MRSRLLTDWRWFGVNFGITIVVTADDMVEVPKANQLALINYVVKEMINVV